MTFPETIKLTRIYTAYDHKLGGEYATGETCQREFVAADFVERLVSMQSGEFRGSIGDPSKHPYTTIILRMAQYDAFIEVRESPDEIRARIEAIPGHATTPDAPGAEGDEQGSGEGGGEEHDLHNPVALY